MLKISASVTTMFHRMFGRRRSPVEGEPNADSGTEATEGQADIVNSDDFVLLGDTESQQSTMYDPPPGYTVGGANAFLPYGLDPSARPEAGQRPTSAEVQTAIDGIPFKLGSNVLLQGDADSCDISSISQMIHRINSFNWDEYEYSFQLEKSVLQEFSTREQPDPE
nr:uncharacterized protein LOC113811160 isoform X2 [Penaeus vannamei]